MSHAHASEENPWAGQGAVLLDIGGDVGALVVEMPDHLLGVEYDVRPLGTPPGSRTHHPHVAVVPRPLGTEVVATLVYPDLREGSYELCAKGTDEVELTATVHGGQVTEASWPLTPGGAGAAPSGDRGGGG